MKEKEGHEEARSARQVVTGGLGPLGGALWTLDSWAMADVTGDRVSGRVESLGSPPAGSLLVMLNLEAEKAKGAPEKGKVAEGKGAVEMRGQRREFLTGSNARTGVCTCVTHWADRDRETMMLGRPSHTLPQLTSPAASSSSLPFGFPPRKPVPS